MKRIEGRWLLGAFAFAVVTLFLLAACAGEGGVSGARAGYIAEMGSFSVVQAPAMAEEAAEDAEADAAATEEAAAPAEPAMVTVLLDFLIHNEGSGTLDGVTVDLTIAGPDGNEKERHLLWVDTTGLTKGSQRQVAHELTDVAYVEGDGFHVEVRHPIPMEERGDYAEFDAEN
ncbi:MAG: hypothetical protein OYL92_07210 [Acidobacteriota bacterium]|nr:hypothetical protein [Acidobacteriota bacterium]MDE2923782.1 hypothetical protein [Acidobacteriota bacterium]MDE3264744.1 hypothetical protein [Acidobacteriota bacterium]